MEAEAISATIRVLVQNLINFSKGEISLIRGLDENADKLRSTFGMIQSFLDDAQKKFITDDAIKRWLKELEDVAFDADNVLDELNHKLLSDNRRKKVLSCFPSFNHCLHRRDMALRINKINMSFESIGKNALELGLERSLADAPAAPDHAAASETDSFTIDPIFIGRENDVSEIVEMLTACPTLAILPIVGMGGLGKTTLARNVFSHEKTKTHYEKRIWVHVSRDFDAIVLLKKILTNLEVRVFEDESREVLLRKLHDAMGSKTYLLVLDDVWNEDRKKWEDFIHSWSAITSSRRSGILVTTRSAEVCLIVKTLGEYHLDFLSNEQCWSIIKGKAFKGGDIPPGLGVIGTGIVRRCQGLALAANVVGGMMRDKSHDEWLSIEKRWLSGIGGDEDDISKILKLSFYHLPSPSLKKCFAYCSIFPKGARINKAQLIELWMAEGFLQTSDMENVGNQFLKVLVHNSLLQVVDRDEYDEIKHCSMHDLVHDVAHSVLGFPRLNNNISDDTYQARYIRWKRSGDESRRIPKEQAKWLRAIFYEDNISNFKFRHFKSLHTLTLMVDYDVKELPHSIRELIHLRCLHISGTSIKSLPESIGELYHLQTLRVTPRKLPATLMYLINLRHLHVPNYTKLPPHLGRLTSLQTLPYFDVRDEDGYRIVELEGLINLKGELKIDNLEAVPGEEESMKADLLQKTGIVKLALLWSAHGESREGDTNVLNGLQPHPNLKILEVAGFKGAKFPLWTSMMAVYIEGSWEGLNNLTMVSLSNCTECDEIPSLGHLPRLKSLYLSSLLNVKFIGSSFYGMNNYSSNNGVCEEEISVFPVLERLELWDMPNLTEWEEVEIPSFAEVKVFPYLKYLKIRECKQLRSAPTQFTCLEELIIDEMDSYLPLASICGNKLKTLTELKIGNVDGLTTLPDWLLHNNQNLLMLEIRDCPNLIQLPDGLCSLNSLVELNFRRCDNLRSIPFSSGNGLTSLSTLSIWGCPKLINFPGGKVEKLCIDVGDSDSWQCASFKKAVNELLRIGLQSICRLELRGEDWDSFPNQLQHMTALSHLFLYDFGVEELPEWFGNFSSLRELSLSHCRKLRRLPSAEAMRRLTNLTDLLIYSSPLLGERCVEQQSDEVDSEWPKICHIPNIRIGLRQIRRGGRQPSREFEYGFKCMYAI